MSDVELLRTTELLSWVDVARRLSYLSRDNASNYPPTGVVASSAFWSGLTIDVLDGTAPGNVLGWLRSVFGSWLVEGPTGDLSIKLAAPAGMEILPVFLRQISTDEQEAHVYQPHAALDGDRHFHTTFPKRDAQPNLPIYAFHSVKGGVGRTTAAIAFAVDSASNSKPVLLVDADFEAPGLSFLLRSRKSESTVSFEDLLALAHADRKEDFSSTIDFVADRMADQRVDDVFVLPAKRVLDDLAGFAIRPENLLSARIDNPYVVVDILRELASKLDCRAVIVDLRPGLVDVSVQFLTDPSVERVFVSTAAGQSVSALQSMLRTLGLVERQNDVKGRQPFVILNQVPIYRLSDSRFRTELTESLLSVAEHSFLQPRQETSDSSVAFGFVPHLTDLIATSGDWDSFIREIQMTNFSRLMFSEMHSWSGLEALSGTVPTHSIPKAQGSQIDHGPRCQRLEDFAGKLEVAETADSVAQPLVTPPLQRLASDFLSQVPIVVIEGAKGTGKTLTARYLLERTNWRDAVNKLDENLKCSFEGAFLPLFGSVASSDAMLRLVSAARERMAMELGSGQPASTLSNTEQSIKARLAAADETQSWLDFWLGEIAAAAGFQGIDAWNKFIESARSSGRKPIILVEGLEEVLTDPFLTPRQADALVSLLREVPLRLREEAGRPVGYVAFVRADMVEAAMVQNLAQFRSGYANYALTWRDTDIKELVVWLVSNSDAIPGLWSSEWRKKTIEEQDSDLREIWGLKLGSDDSREARTTEWVISVLTDLTGRLTARDLVRFVGDAARASRSQPSSDRLLAASALKRAVDVTSRKKIEEYPKEVRQLGPIFDKFMKHPAFETPFRRAQASEIGISEFDLDILEKYGVAYQEDGLFEVPELFRIGLEMKRGGARPNIISLTRRARERAKA